jgi:hypothetical protein
VRLRGRRTRTSVPYAAQPLSTTGSQTGVLALSILVASAAGLLWFVLATATGLIFHFLPGASFLAGAWAYRWRPGTGPAPWSHVAAILVAGLVVTAVILGALGATGQPLDDARMTVAVAAAGALLASGWLRLRWRGLRTSTPSARGRGSSERPSGTADR